MCLKHIRVYEINGPLFFGVADRIADIYVKDYTKCLILRMRSVPAIDTTALIALENLYEKCKKNGITVVFSHVNEQPMNAMKKAGFIEKAGADNFCGHIDEALKESGAVHSPLKLQAVSVWIRLLYLIA